MKYLLDTCMISELVAKRPNAKVLAWIDTVDEGLLYLSVITLGEIRKGIEMLSESDRKDRLESWLQDDLVHRFDGRILPLDTAVLLLWGRLTGRLEKEGKKTPAIDSLIAATALCHGLTLATRNEADFEHTGVTLFNPWR